MSAQASLLDSRLGTYLQIPVAELAVVEDKSLIDQTGFCELYIGIPAYAH
jgi:hypothetical protein